MRILTCLGDATLLHTWSNTPFFFLQAGKSAEFLDAGWRLAPDRLRYHRLVWNAWRIVRHGESGGFQYSPFFLRRLHAQAEAPGSAEIEIISHFPLLPPSGAHNLLTSYYIDATLAQNFENYAVGGRYGLGPRTVGSALERERIQYAEAKRIVCMSKWAAQSVVERYGVDPIKVHIVPGGANFGEIAVESASISRVAPIKPVRLGFIGKDWRRKNLPFLLSVVDILDSRGVAAEVVAAGFDPASGPRHPLMRAVGFIDKQSEMQRFINLIRSTHFCCLFSIAEAFGISNRECLRLGVPVLARDVGGIRDTVPEGCGHLFPPEAAAAADVAAVIHSYVRDPARYLALRAHVTGRSCEFTWDAAVQKMIAIWSGSDAYSYAQYLSRRD